jgi:hypothetical protein
LHDGASAEGNQLGGDGPASTADTGGGGGGDAAVESATTDSTSPEAAMQDQTSPTDSSMQDVVTPKDAVAESAPSESGSDTSTGGDTGTGSETGTTCSSATGCYVIPSGWTLVAFAPSQGTACPTGFAAAAPTNLVEGPNTTNVCSCGACSIGTQPTCPGGPIAVDYGYAIGGNCGTTTTALADSPVGGCDTDVPTLPLGMSYSGINLKLTPPAATGAQCTSAGTASGTLTYADEDRACTMDSAQAAGCSGDDCTPNLAAPYVACVVKSGDVACPGAPFTVQHVVGTSATLTCAGCGCDVSAVCTGTVSFFTDNMCTMGDFDVKADGTGCYAAAAPGGGLGGTRYGSYKYAANPPGNVSCAVTGTSAANLALTNEETICCVP